MDAHLDAETVLARLDARTADLLRRVYADGESLRAAGRAIGVGETLLAAIRSPDGRGPDYVITQRSR